MTRDPMDYGWWLASRASGLVALALITLSVGVGLAMAGRAFQKPGLAKKLMALHEHAALAGLIAIAVHGITLLGDSWLHPGPVGIAVPFTMDYKPAFTGLGIVGGYLAAALGLSLLRAPPDRREAVAQAAPRDDPRLRPRGRPHAGRGHGRAGAVARGSRWR